MHIIFQKLKTRTPPESTRFFQKKPKFSSRFINVFLHRSGAGTHQIPHGHAFPPPVCAQVDENGTVDVPQVQYEQPVVGHVYVIARDEQSGHAEQMLALRFGVRPAQRGSHDARGLLH